MTSYFVAGIGTGIGKTFATCALLHAARTKGRAVQGYKPVISGWSDCNDTDTAHIIAASGSQQTHEEISPWRFTAPRSPHMAVTPEEKAIAFDELVAWTHQHKNATSLTLIETVGGVMVPLNDNKTTLDWMQEIALPVILVTGSYLGSINHTLMTMDVLGRRGIAIAALVLNESVGSTIELIEAEAGLEPFTCDIPLRIAQPLVSSWREATHIHRLQEQL